VACSAGIASRLDNPLAHANYLEFTVMFVKRGCEANRPYEPGVLDYARVPVAIHQGCSSILSSCA